MFNEHAESIIVLGIAVALMVFFFAWAFQMRRQKRAELEKYYHKKRTPFDADAFPDDDFVNAPSDHVTELKRPPVPKSKPVEALLKESSHLRRLLEVNTPEGIYFVEYNGNGLGYETVLVNGREAVKTVSMLWFVPRFEFRLGTSMCAIEVRVWPWLRFRYFALEVDGVIAYEE